jgi:serine/threonine-protein kinase RsbT
MSDITHASLPIADQQDVIRVRSAGREVARALGFSTVDQTRVATAISELARNALSYAGGGLCTISTSTDQGEHTLRVIVSDEGQGIADVALALQPGFSTGGSLGQGLPAVRRLMNSLEIDSRPGRTIVTATMRRRV